MMAVLDSLDETKLIGYRVFDRSNKQIQFIAYEEDLSEKVPEYIRGEIPNAQPVVFDDCHFDGFVDAMINDNCSPRYASFQIWRWDPRHQKFVLDEQLTDAGINVVDSKSKTVSSGGSGGSGHFGIKTYKYLASGKLALVYTDFIDGGENYEVKTYYVDGKASKVVKSVAPDDQ
jgi:hypothetical protein